MNQDSLQAEAEKLLQSMQQVPPREPGEKLRPRDELQILVMVKEQQMSQEAAAEAVGCHQSTVCRVLAKYDDTRPLARKRLEAAALEVAERAIREGDPLKLLAKLDVIREDKEVGSSTGIVIHVGQPGHPVRLPDIDVCPDDPPKVLNE
jgi:predicted XRE-type DNA-binding protein